MPTPPPPVLDLCRVVAYAYVDESVEWTGRQMLFVGDERLGPVPCVALGCEPGDGLPEVMIFYCNEAWEVLGATGAESISAAKAKAERAYRGISARWVDTNVTPEMARAWIEENHNHLFCLFCGRAAEELEYLFTGKLGAICSQCIDEYHASLHQVRQGKNGG